MEELTPQAEPRPSVSQKLGLRPHGRQATDRGSYWVSPRGGTPIAFGAKKVGVVSDIWKCVGTRRVMAVVNVDSLDTLDQMLLDLPIMKEQSQHVRVDVTPLRGREDFATDLKGGLSKGC
jgi:Muconolactone delta-isomerase